MGWDGTPAVELYPNDPENNAMAEAINGAKWGRWAEFEVTVETAKYLAEVLKDNGEGRVMDADDIEVYRWGRALLKDSERIKDSLREMNGQ